MNQDNQLNFSDQHFYVGIDVHLKRWSVSIRNNGIRLKVFSMDPSPVQLHRFLSKHYPQGIYHSVYEAGFSGFWIHQQLVELGIDNRVIHPSDVPSTHKERERKNDTRDAQKLARELENNSLKAIYVPDLWHQQFRSLSRLRHSLVKEQTRLKNMIKSFLYFYGVALPQETSPTYWSKVFLDWLAELPLDHPPARDCLDTYLTRLHQVRSQLAQTMRQLRTYSRQEEVKPIIHDYLGSVAGIGFKTAVTFYAEVMDIRRFRRDDQLFAYVGLAPSVYSSADTEIIRGLTKRRNRYLRHVIVEAAWNAIRKDPALTAAYQQLSARMNKQKAIIRIAKKLVSRMRHVWLNETTYQLGVIQ